jgi:hypothetical protein
MADSLPATQVTAVARLNRVMALAGWEIHYIDLDLSTDHPQAEIKVVRDDGRWLWAKVDARGRSVMESFQRSCYLGMSPGRKGRLPLSPQVDDQFLGRQTFEGPRSMLRSLTAYLADNSLRPVPLADLRTCWAAIMGAPLRLEAPSGVAAPGAETFSHQAPMEGKG